MTVLPQVTMKSQEYVVGRNVPHFFQKQSTPKGYVAKRSKLRQAQTTKAIDAQLPSAMSKRTADAAAGREGSKTV